MFTTTRRVEFSDTDAAGIMHFSAFFLMMESAEHEMIRSLGFSVMPGNHDQLSVDKASVDKASHSAQQVTWPRVSAKCDYLQPARFEDEVRIEVSVSRLGKSSVSYAFTFLVEDQPIAKGALVAVCCHLRRGQLNQGQLSKVTIPDWIRQKLQTHVISN